ncbi:hypothetical protein, partial [Streptomyces sp. NPDC051561]|uniref:hypothetical protein n=1 Tax=Streptomyces sp. NPDC051561 TaxID=3365658 RepID=UPI00379541D7
RAGGVGFVRVLEFFGGAGVFEGCRGLGFGRGRAGSRRFTSRISAFTINAVVNSREFQHYQGGIHIEASPGSSYI